MAMTKIFGMQSALVVVKTLGLRITRFIIANGMQARSISCVSTIRIGSARNCRMQAPIIVCHTRLQNSHWEWVVTPMSPGQE
jgi:hypothetical protein